MGIPSNPDACASRLKALADPTRLGVLMHLMQSPCTVGELVQRIGVEQSLMSHHLQVLRNVGLAEGLREGRNVRYHPTSRVDRAGTPTGIDLGCCTLDFGGDGIEGPRP